MINKFGLLFLIVILSHSVISQTFADKENVSYPFIKPNEAISVDLNNDGLVDVVVAYKISKMLVWYKNLGDQLYSKPIIIGEDIGQLQSVHKVDLDNDGDEDLVFASSSTGGRIAWFENLGNGEFSESNDLYTDGWEDPYDIEIGDYDNDGDQDIMAIIFYDGVHTFENLGDGEFLEHNLIGGVGIVSGEYVDLNGDTHLDMLIGSTGSQKVTWYLNDGTGGYSFGTVISDDMLLVQGAKAADLDNDGDLDVVCSAWGEEGVTWFENDGLGIFSEYQLISEVEDSSYGISLADMDGDGLIDILSASYHSDMISWYKNLGDGMFSEKIFIEEFALGAKSVEAVDMDGDGDLDALTSLSEGRAVSWYENNGAGDFINQHYIVANESFYGFFDLVDLNGDGLDEVITSVNSFGPNKSNIISYSNLGELGFLDSKRLSQGEELTSRYYKVIDLENDGDLDIVFWSFSSDALGWLENIDGNEFEVHEDIWTDGTNIDYVEVGLIDDDEFVDLVVSTNSKVVKLLNDGSNNFINEVILYDESFYAARINLVDLNNDSLLDLTLNLSGGTTEFYRFMNAGGGSFGDLIYINEGSFQEYKMDDFDLDGDVDVMYKNFDNEIIWLKNDGTGSFPEQLEIEYNIEEASGIEIEAFDVDNDGTKELFIGSYNPGGIRFLTFNEEEQTFTNQESLDIEINSISMLLFKDFDNDGDADLFANSREGEGSIVFYENLSASSCTDDNACNYNPMATEEGEDCEYNSCVDCVPDFNNDGLLDGLDLEVLLGSFGCAEGCNGDVNGDGIVNIEDLVLYNNFSIYMCE